MHELGSYRQAISYMQALAFLYDNLSRLPIWVQRLTPGQMEQLAQVLNRWQVNGGGLDKVQPLAEIERREVMRALALCKGDICAAAKELRIGKTTLYRRLKEWGFTSANWQAISQASALATVSPRGARSVGSRTSVSTGG